MEATVNNFHSNIDLTDSIEDGLHYLKVKTLLFILRWNWKCVVHFNKWSYCMSLGVYILYMPNLEKYSSLDA